MTTITIPDNSNIQETTRVAYGPTATPGEDTFAVPFPFFSTTELTVWGSTSGYLVETTHWTIATVDVDDGYQSGTITLLTPVIAEDLLIWRNIDFSRVADWQTSGPFPMASINTTMDKLYAMMQEVRTMADRSIRLDDTDVTETVVLPGVDERKGKYLYFDSVTGSPSVSETIIVDDTPATISSWVTDNWHPLTSAAAARTLLGLTVGVDVQAYDATNLVAADMVIGSDVQAWDAGLDDIAALAVTDGNIIVGDGTNWVAESDVVARASLGLIIGTDVLAYDSNVLVVGDIGTTVQYHGDTLDDIRALSAPTTDGQFIVATGAGAFNYESDTTAITSLGADYPNSLYSASDNRAVVLADAFTTIRINRAGANTITLPSHSAVPFPINTEIYFMQYGDGATTIAISVDDLFVESSLTKVLNGKYAVAGAKKVLTNTWVLFGNLVAA